MHDAIPSALRQMIPSLLSSLCNDECTMRRGVGVATTGEEVTFVAIKHTDELTSRQKGAMPFIHFSERFELLPRLRKATRGNRLERENVRGQLYTGKPSRK